MRVALQRNFYKTPSDNGHSPIAPDLEASRDSNFWIGEAAFSTEQLARMLAFTSCL